VAFLESRGYPYEILSEDTYSVVVDKLADGATDCSLCSRLRRGILYTAAERLGCNKIALGHHRDDGLETFLMNLFFSGKLQAMPARFRTDDGRFEVIRPLVECPEALIAEYARLAEYPILPCNLCGSQPNLQRDKMTALISELEKSHPDVRSVMAAALANVRASHLLDQRLVSRLAEGQRPSPDAHGVRPPRPRHASATPTRSNLRHLKIIGS
jgi:tRNA 2-thiocytidine biosynthesis protein TtcA